MLFVVVRVPLAVHVHLQADSGRLVAALVQAEAQIQPKADNKALDVEMLPAAAVVLVPYEPHHLNVECIGYKTLLVCHWGLAWERLPSVLGAGKVQSFLVVVEHYLEQVHRLLELLAYRLVQTSEERPDTVPWFIPFSSK